MTPEGVEPDDVFNTSEPNIARVYDFWLQGKDNFKVDRDQAERLIRVYPELPLRVRENRKFLTHAVSWAARQGVRQFIDIGSGLPTAHNTHEAAQDVDASCRVVYADNDQLVVRHALARLAGTGVAVINADLTKPETVFTDPKIEELINPEEPCGLVLAMILHFFPAEEVQRIMKFCTDRLAPGSYVILSVGSSGEALGDLLAREYEAASLHNHAPETVEKFFGELELVPPGVVDARHWDPNVPEPPAVTAPLGRVLAAVGRKRGT